MLSIDTSVGTAVSIVESDGVVLSVAASPNPLGHAEVIGGLLVRALAEASLTAAGIAHVAAGMGPGPFTGLRVGIAAARTFAQGRGVPVVPVVSHDAIALEVFLADALTDAETPRFAVVTDARRREFAYSVYDGIDDDGLPIRSAGPELIARDALDERLAALGARRHDAAAVPAAMLGLAASRALGAGRTIGPDDALYLRSPDVTVSAGPKRVTP
ncbi:tRNA (adenosine(37)-N6)-threonylcarbamoyltransferase complex dimerization subunit type 1 TsaB [Microbacterium rhizomatis]|uniref:tRNA (Adenosine(37)-N6)-threonylcarbamoyltransferase complex dimerization subunit type 1 TsaB n=1 Tax=Microbacterium rhizomatis TaxID=1631477 RepID=A0A5J5J588_9MICO|nr:tRNA (adenosine(37)-N6)-threonylcarbamoyltransferase complex dimerization subunit type 1 TsaB [Microbacterium rhizomatis]